MTVIADDDEATLGAGEAGVFSGDIEVESDSGAAYVAAIIGERAPTAQPADVAGEGGIILWAESCPPGTTLPEIQVTPATTSSMASRWP